MLNDRLAGKSIIAKVVIVLFVVSNGRVGQGLPAGFTIHLLDQLFPAGLQNAAWSLCSFCHVEAMFRFGPKVGADPVKPFQLFAFVHKRAGL